MGRAYGELNSFRVAPWSLCKRSSNLRSCSLSFQRRSKKEREKDRLVLLTRGRDDLLLLAYLNLGPLLCQTLTCPHGEISNPSGSVP